MNLKGVKKIISMHPNFKICKKSREAYAILDSTAKEEIQRGFLINNYRHAVSLSFWLTPKICLPSSDIIVFSNYYADINDREIFLDKSLSTEDQISEKIADSVNYNMPILQEINSLVSLEKYISSNQQKWLVSDFSKIQFGILDFYNNRDLSAIKMVKSVYPLINPLHPIAKEIDNFVSLVENGDEAEIDRYFDSLKKLTEERFIELYK